MISRRQFLSRSAGAAAGAFAANFALRSAAAKAAGPPNILFIYTDDQAVWTIRQLGHANPVTPHLDRLFGESVQCANAFTTTPVCSPSRAGLICSRYGTEVGITDWIRPPDANNRNEEEIGLDPATPTWVGQLRDAGYRTGLVGKWHLGTLDKYHPSQFGYDHFAGFREGGAAVENPVLEIGGEKKEVKGLTVDLLTDLAVEFIREAKQPFMLSLHHRSPHAPWMPGSAEDAAAFAGRKLEIPNPDFPELDVERVDQLMGEYLQSVSGVDRSVGRLMALLEEMNLVENTLVVFTSDHGYNIGHHGIIHKGNGSWITLPARELAAKSPLTARSNMFDTSMRVPLAVRWPARLKAGRVVEETVTNLDWFPTLLAAAGLETPAEAGVRGRNFLPLLLGETLPWDNDLFGQYSQHHYVEANMRSYRSEDWKLVRFFGVFGRDELYCLADDPGETVNLIHTERGSGPYRRLNEKLLASMRAIGDPLAPAGA